MATYIGLAIALSLAAVVWQLTEWTTSPVQVRPNGKFFNAVWLLPISGGVVGRA